LPKKEEGRMKDAQNPTGPVDFSDEWGQAWRSGQRLL
jgi:hypothetical protein